MIHEKTDESLKKLAKYQSQFIGQAQAVNTVSYAPEDLPFLKLNWDGYIYKSELDNGLTSYASISADGSTMAILLLSTTKQDILV